MPSVLKTDIQTCDSQTDVHVVSTAPKCKATCSFRLIVMLQNGEEEKMYLKFNNKQESEEKSV